MKHWIKIDDAYFNLESCSTIAYHELDGEMQFRLLCGVKTVLEFTYPALAVPDEPDGVPILRAAGAQIMNYLGSQMMRS